MCQFESGALRPDGRYRGEIRRRRDHDQNDQTHCLNLLTNAVIAWNTVYISAIRDHLIAAGYPIPDDTIARISSAVRDHINLYGRYDLHTITTPRPGQLRPFRNPP